jgi:RNA methyltransferase, TrmH family
MLVNQILKKMLSKSQVKYIQSLYHKKFRDEEGLFFAEGPRLINDLLASGRFVCRQLFGTALWQAEMHALQPAFSGEWVLVTDAELQRISALTTPHQVLGVFEQAGADVNFSPKGVLTLVLDSIQDPGNMGSILRTADWFGIKNVVCTSSCVEVYNPKVVQGSMGSIARLNIVYTDVAAWLSAHAPIPVMGAVLEGKNMREVAVLKEGILMMGNEGNGISDSLLPFVTLPVTIPRLGGAESLNVAVATGILLSQFCTPTSAI